MGTQYRDGIVIERWKDITSDLQTATAQRQDHVAELKRIVDKVHSLRQEIDQLTRSAHVNINDTFVLGRALNILARDLGLSSISLVDLERLDKEIHNQE